MNILEDHLKEYWTTHLAAGSGTAYSLMSGSSILQSLIVGVLLFVITSLLRKLFPKFFGVK